MAAPAPIRRGGSSVIGQRASLRVGLVCPYSFDVPGGVQNHVLGLARYLRDAGHRPQVLAPGELGPAAADARRRGILQRRLRCAAPLQRLGGPGELWTAQRRSGTPLAPEGRVRPPPHSRTDHPKHLAAGALGGRAACGGDLPHRDSAFAIYAIGGRSAARGDREDRCRNCRVRVGPQCRRPAPRARRRGHSQRDSSSMRSPAVSRCALSSHD